MTEGVLERFGQDILARLARAPERVRVLHPRKGLMHFTLTLEAVRERMALDVAGACARIAAAPPGRRVRFLTVHGSADAVIPVRDARLFAEAVPGSGLRVVEGADHNFTQPAQRAEMVAAVVEFFAAPE